MDKLELKHLCHYLPYSITFSHFDDEREIKSVCEFAEITRDEITITNSDYQYTLAVREVKPILRPMSEWRLLENGTMFFTPSTHSLVDADGGLEANIMSIPYTDFIWLVSEKFDVFGLIEKGLAIDINTLEQEVQNG